VKNSQQALSLVVVMTLTGLTTAAFAESNSTPVFQGGTNSGGAGSVINSGDSVQIPDVVVINATCYFIYDDLPACVFENLSICDYVICLAFDPGNDPEDEPEIPNFPEAR
jgi:hypothetical protein